MSPKKLVPVQMRTGVVKALEGFVKVLQGFIKAARIFAGPSGAIGKNSFSNGQESELIITGVTPLKGS
jgi:hypothetical protein